MRHRLAALLIMVCGLTTQSSAQNAIRLRFVVASPAIVMEHIETFTDSAGTNLTSHSGELGDWTKQTGATGSMVVSNVNAARLDTASTFTSYYSTAIPSVTSYVVTVDFVVKTTPAGHFYWVQAHGDTAAYTYYQGVFDCDSNEWKLAKVVNTATTVLGTPYGQTLVDGQTYQVRLDVADGSQKLYIDGALRVSATDSDAALTSAGRAGLGGYTFDAVTNSTGIHYDNFSVTNSDPLPGPTYDVELNPGDDIQAIINANGSGTSYLLKTGTFLNQTISPKTGDSFTGESGAILNGGRVLTSATSSGGVWYYTGQTQSADSNLSGIDCDASYPRCYDAELFFDNVRKHHEASLGAVGAGDWFFDYAADRIYVGDNPAGHTVVTQLTGSAFLPSANNVTLHNLTIQFYASALTEGIIDPGNGWTMTGNTVRWNQGIGMRVETDTLASGNFIYSNGRLGAGGGGVQNVRQATGIVFEDNELYENNAAHYNFFNEGGATKFTFTSGLIVRLNYVHDNRGHSLWSDVDNYNVLYENNLVEDNDGSGIFQEIGYSAIIRNNIIRRNGVTSGAVEGYGGCIIASESENVEVYGNTCDSNTDGIIGIGAAGRGTGFMGLWVLRNFYVHDNTVKLINTANTYNGVLASYPGTFTTLNNRFEDNDYEIPSDGFFFAWNNAARLFADWQSYGLDEPGGSAVVY